MLNSLTSFRPSGIQANVLYRAIVIDNNDPKKKQRVRVRISEVMDFDEPDHHPWILPAHAHSDGASDVTGTVAVPKNNSIIGVKFQQGPDGQGSAYHGRYEPYPTSDTTQLEEGDHHYPNRIVHKFANGASVILDTEDDSLWLYNPGESHLKSKGKLCIKSEETFVLVSDIEIGLRAPEIAVRAKEKLILESEADIVMRAGNDILMEARNDLIQHARRDITLTTEERHIKLTTLNEKAEIGNIELLSTKDRVKLIAQGEQNGRKSNVELRSRKNDVLIEALGEVKGEKSEFYARVVKNDIRLIAEGENWKQEENKIEISNWSYDVKINANKESRDGLMRMPVLELDNADGSGKFNVGKKNWPSALPITAGDSITLAAPLVTVSMG